MDAIQVFGAAIHNLKKINVVLPKGKLIVFTGVSGSGKSSLAFDILYEEGRKRYLNSIGFGSRGEVTAETEPFDEIIGLPPAIAVEQSKIRQSNPRSIVGTRTKALQDLKSLYALDGRDEHGLRTELTPNHYAFYASSADCCSNCEGRGYFAQPDIGKIIADPNRRVSKIVSAISAQLDKYLMRLERDNKINWRHAVYAELTDDIQQQVLWGIDEYEGIMNFIHGRIRMKPAQQGEYEQLWFSRSECGACGGKRMGERARNSLIGGRDISELCAMTVADLLGFFTRLASTQAPFTPMGRQLTARLCTLFRLFTDVGLSHLTLLRSIPTLSGGELQRLYLMMHLESKFDSLLYVFDEPTAGLHEREKQSLIDKLKQLSRTGNSVIVVEHDPNVIRLADYIVELGPGAGRPGGNVMFQGTYAQYLTSEDTVLPPYLSGDKPILEKSREQYRTVGEQTPKLAVRHASLHNLRNVNMEIPLGVMVGIAGVSGSGKSTLIMDTLVPLLKQRLAHDGTEDDEDGDEDHLEEPMYGENPIGLLEGSIPIRRCVLVSQKLIGRSRASTPAAYIGIWDKIRQIFAEQPEAVSRGYTASHFSFNLEQGQCPSCRGVGAETVDMGAIGLVSRVCAGCRGRRYKDEVLDIAYDGKTIWDVIEMNPVEALEHFRGYKAITLMLETLIRVGLDYLSLGQPITTISGGEAQRIKLAKELGRAKRDNTLYVLDEPTTGLGSPDIAKLMALLESFVNQGNSVIIIEHDQSVLSVCDWVIEMGPGGGSEGGVIVNAGPPLSI